MTKSGLSRVSLTITEESFEDEPPIEFSFRKLFKLVLIVAHVGGRGKGGDVVLLYP